MAKYWSFSFSISPCNEYSGLISFYNGLIFVLAVQGMLKNLLQHHSSKASIFWCLTFFMVSSHIPVLKTSYIIVPGKGEARAVKVRLSTSCFSVESVHPVKSCISAAGSGPLLAGDSACWVGKVGCCQGHHSGALTRLSHGLCGGAFPGQEQLFPPILRWPHAFTALLTGSGLGMAGALKISGEQCRSAKRLLAQDSQTFSI